MERREFMTLLGGAAVGWPFAASAQQRVLPVIGYLGASSAEASRVQLAAFHKGLNGAGFVEGQSVLIEYRWADGQYDRLGALAADLVQHRVSVIVTTSSPSMFAAKAATATIPIVFFTGVDPIGAGLVASFNRPNGNATGVYNFTVDVEANKLQLLHDLLPQVAVIAVLINPSNPVSSAQLKVVQRAAGIIGLQIRVLSANTESNVESAIANAVQQGARALLVCADSFFFSSRDHLVALAARHVLPAIFDFREFVVAGGLMSYGSSLTDSFRELGAYSGRILKGEKPADLPVLQPTRVELVINLKTAKALGLTVPPTLLTRADEVIE
jgi:ABC-type uncharacterized transport system substrate-binding protein